MTYLSEPPLLLLLVTQPLVASAPLLYYPPLGNLNLSTLGGLPLLICLAYHHDLCRKMSKLEGIQFFQVGKGCKDADTTLLHPDTHTDIHTLQYPRDLSHCTLLQHYCSYL